MLGVTGFVYVGATSSGSNLLYLAFGVLVGALVISVPVAEWSLRRLEIRRNFGEHIVAGQATDITYHVASRKRHWATMALQFRELNGELAEAPRGFILHLATGRAGEPVRVATQLAARRRGVIRLEAIEVSTTFPFGFLRRTRRLHVPQDMVVYPRIGMLNRHLALEYRESVESGAMTSNRRGGHDEFYGVARIPAGGQRAGDPLAFDGAAGRADDPGNGGERAAAAHRGAERTDVARGCGRAGAGGAGDRAGGGAGVLRFFGEFRGGSGGGGSGGGVGGAGAADGAGRRGRGCCGSWR